MPVYVIAEIDVRDAAGFETYRTQVPPFIAKHGGEYLVRGGAVETIEGSWRPGRMVVLRFPDKAAAKAFLDDPGYKPLADLRQRVAPTDMILVDGL